MQINSIQDVAATVRGRRQELGLSQADWPTRAGVSRDWVNQIEAAKATAEFGLVIRLLDALRLRLDIDVRASGDDTPTGGSVDLDALLNEDREQWRTLFSSFSTLPLPRPFSDPGGGRSGS